MLRITLGGSTADPFSSPPPPTPRPCFMPWYSCLAMLPLPCPEPPALLCSTCLAFPALLCFAIALPCPSAPAFLCSTCLSFPALPCPALPYTALFAQIWQHHTMSVASSLVNSQICHLCRCARRFLPSARCCVTVCSPCLKQHRSHQRLKQQDLVLLCVLSSLALISMSCCTRLCTLNDVSKRRHGMQSLCYQTRTCQISMPPKLKQVRRQV